MYIFFLKRVHIFLYVSDFIQLRHKKIIRKVFLPDTENCTFCQPYENFIGIFLLITEHALDKCNTFREIVKEANFEMVEPLLLQ